MSSFTRSALEMLQAAEDALHHPRSTSSAKRVAGPYEGKENAGLSYTHSPVYSHHHRDPHDGVGDHTAAYSESSAVRELQGQLSRVVREVIELRGELAAERDRRHETLVAIGRQWKEELLVEVQRRDSALHADVAALEERVAAQAREGGEARLVMRRQLEEAVRAAKVRDTDRFHLREELAETTRHVEERVEAALAQSAAVRVDCTRQLEQERASLSQRVDAELLRLVEMRRDDQRALQAATEAQRQDGRRLHEEVRRAVQEVWDSTAAALMKTATEPVEQLRAEVRQCRAAAHAAQEGVADCVRSCQAECRLCTSTTAERLHALESGGAAAASRVDRAERKADAAFEMANRMEAAVLVAKEATERSQLQAASAMERAQRVEHALSDRDARLVAVESHLHGVATAEGLRAEVEACRRQTSRLESRAEAVASMCQRVEQVADKTLRQVADFDDRVSACEQLTQRSGEAAQAAQEAAAACRGECQQLSGRLDACDGAVQRHSQVVMQLEQRILGQENRLALWRQQQEQHTKDQQVVQREVTERAEVTHAVATRAQQISSDARADVGRLERRCDDADRAMAAAAAESAGLRAATESQRAQLSELQRQLQNIDDAVRAVDRRTQERVAPVAELERCVAQRCERIEGHAERLVKKVAQCEREQQEMGTRVQDYVKDAIRHHVADAQRRLLAALNDGIGQLTERLAGVEATVAAVQGQAGGTAPQVDALRDSLSVTQRSLQALEGRVQAVRSHVEQLSLHADASSSDHERLSTAQQDITRLVGHQQRLQQDVVQLQEMVRAMRDAQLARPAAMAALSRDHTLSQLAGSQAATASTEMAGSAGPDSSSPSAHIPPNALTRVTGGVTQQARKAVTATTTLASTVQPSVPTHHHHHQQQQQPQRAASHSESGSKEGSGERPPSHLSGVSSVRATEEGVAQLHSIAEGAAPPQQRHPSSASAQDEEEEKDEDDELVASLAGGADAIRSARPLSASLAPADTTGNVSAAAAPHASVVANTSHPTVIRGFTTIDSTSSDSDGESREGAAEPASGRRGSRTVITPAAATAARSAATHQRSGVGQRLANTGDGDDAASSDGDTTEVTLTSDAAATPVRVGPAARRVRPASAQHRTVTMTAAWQTQRDEDDVSSHVNDDDDEAAAVDVVPQAGQSTPSAAAQAAEETDSEDAVQPMNGAGAPVNAWAAEGTPAAAAAPHHHDGHEDAAESATDSAPVAQHPAWDDWDMNEEEEDEEEASAAEAVPREGGLQSRQEGSDGDSDMVMQMNDVEDMDDDEGVRAATPPRAQAGARRNASPSSSSTTSVASSPVSVSAMAATTVHHRNSAQATGRQIAMAAAATSPGPRLAVPRHGQNTTSSSSSSAERADALGLRTAAAAVAQQRPATQVRNYTNFDDSTTSDDE